MNIKIIISLQLCRFVFSLYGFASTLKRNMQSELDQYERASIFCWRTGNQIIVCQKTNSFDQNVIVIGFIILILGHVANTSRI